MIKRQRERKGKEIRKGRRRGEIEEGTKNKSISEDRRPVELSVVRINNVIEKIDCYGLYAY